VPLGRGQRWRRYAKSKVSEESKADGAATVISVDRVSHPFKRQPRGALRALLQQAAPQQKHLKALQKSSNK